jgi:glycosyltransferase involved in cell wall biosynthesis
MSTTTAEPIRVAYVISSLGMGGAETMLERMLQNMPPHVTPMVICFTTLGDIGPRLQALGIQVQALQMARGALPTPAALWRLVRALRDCKPDVVHTMMPHADLLGGIAARLCGIRAVMWGLHMSNFAADMNSSATLKVIRLCARLSAWVPMRIASVARSSCDAHVQMGYVADRFVVIPNGFDFSVFHPDRQARGDVRAELGLHADTALVGVIGRFDVQKNQRGFCTAMARLLALRPDTHALLAGTDINSDNAELKAWMHAAGITQRCHLLGPRSDVPRLMAALDVLMLPSMGEAFPNVVGEAMACGLPCAVTEVGDAALMVGALGRVVPKGDMQALGEACALLLALDVGAREQLSQQIVQDVQQRFEIGAVTRRFVDEYQTMRAR